MNQLFDKGSHLMRTRANTRSLAALAVLILALPVSATEQARDGVRYADQQLSMLERPLNDFLLRLPAIPRFDIPSTANYKGYTAGWEVRDSRLYLVSFGATTNRQPFAISLLFPNRKLPLVADWYSGQIHIPSRKETVSEKLYTFDWITILQVTNGVVIATNEIKQVKEDRIKR